MGIANITNNILTDSGAVIGAANGVATLDSGGKIPVSQLPNSVMEFKGTWSAATNNPTLANGTGNAGDVYEVSAAGTVNFGAGGIAFAVGDYVVYDGSTWQYSSGQKGTITSLTFSAPLTGGTITTSGTVGIPAATSTVDGYLSATDWTTFNGKQNALTNPVTGTGTANYLPKFTGASTIGNSIMSESGTAISVAGNVQVRGDWSTTYPVYQLTDTRVGGVEWNIENGREGVGNLSFYRGGTKMLLTTSGNLGLGVTPSASTTPTIEVGYVGNSLVGRSGILNLALNAYRTATWKYANTAAVSNFELYDGGFDWYNAPSGTAGTDISFSLKMRLANTGNLLINTGTDSGYKLDVNGTLRAVSGASPSVFNTATGQGIAIENSGSSNKRYRLNVDGTSFLITEAGVGTPLTIAAGGAATFSSTIAATSATLSGDLTLTSTGGHTINMVATTAGSQTISMTALGGGSNTITGTGGDLNIQTTGAYPIVIKTNSNERLRITSAGQFIHPNTGNQTGLVTYTSNQDDGITYFYQAQNFPTSNAYTRVFDIVSSGDATGGGAIRFLTSAANTAPVATMYLSPAGNIGIGTTAPTGRLTLQRSASAAETDIDFLNEIGAGPKAKIRFGGTNEELSFWTGSTATERMRITQGGNVLIGTTTDAGYKLDVNGSIRGGTIYATTFTDSYITISSAQINRDPGFVEMQYTGTGGVKFFGNTAYPITFASGSGAATFSSDLTLGGNESYLYFNSTYTVGSNSRAKIRTVGAGGGSGYGGDLRFSTRTPSNTWNEDAMTIDSSGKVGIGTTSPGKKLDVSASDENVLRLQRTGASARQWDINISPYFKIGDNTAAADRLVIDTSGLVGIGTASPAFKLDIQGTSDQALRIKSTSANGVIYLEGAERRWGIFGGATSTGGRLTIKDETGNVDAMCFAPAGNVLINTTTDSGYKLDVNGTGRFTTSLGVGAGASNTTLQVNGDWVSGYSTVRIQGATSSQVGLGLYDTAGARKFVFASTGSVGYIETATGVPIDFQLGGTSRIKMSASGVLGVGDLDPTNTYLSVKGDWPSGYATVKIAPSTSYALGGSAGVGLFDSNGSTRFAYFSANNNQIELMVGANKPLMIGTADTERMRITSTGELGIGTTAPGSLLHVSTSGSNTYSSTITKGSNLKGIINTITGNGDEMVGVYFASGSAAGTHWSGITGSRSQNAVDWSTQLNFYTHDENTSNLNDATQKMVIKGSGRVGIGTTSPSYKLDVIGNIRLTTGGTGATYLYFHDFTDYKYIAYSGNDVYWRTSGDHIIEASSGFKATFKANGNLLIGTSTDSGYKLDVNGTGRFSSQVTSSSFTDGYITWSSAQINRSGGFVELQYNSGGGVKLFGAGATPITFNTTGSGTFSSSVTATAFFESSDKTIKTLITDNYQAKGIESVVAKLYIKNGKEELGYYAQDVQGILPSAVSKNDEGLLTLSYREVHTAKIARLEKEVEELKAQLARL